MSVKRFYLEKGRGTALEQVAASARAGAHGFCGGRGVCGRCRVRFASGAPLPSAADRRFFSPQELREGYRLACTARPVSDCDIELCFAVTHPLSKIMVNFLTLTLQFNSPLKISHFSFTVKLIPG